jgi:hypothetical protein
MPTVEVQLARRQWDEGSRRFDEDSKSDPRLLAAFEIVTDELRKRVGQTFSLDQLARAYAQADDWARTAVAERAPFPGWPGSVTLVQDAAFHAYARGATDYVP